MITIFLGLLKLWYDRNKMRKYTKVNKGKQAQTPEMLESQPVTQIPTETKDEIPFGVRAIESGIEVDGVWISRSNTPVGSSRSSIMLDNRLPRSFNNSALELPQTAYASSRGSSQAFDRAVSAERIQTNDSRSSSPQQPYAADGRGRPAAGSSRYSTSNVPRNYAAPSHSSPPSRKLSHAHNLDFESNAAQHPTATTVIPPRQAAVPAMNPTTWPSARTSAHTRQPTCDLLLD